VHQQVLVMLHDYLICQQCHAFIGSNNSLVAPVRVGDKAMTASGSVITKDVPNGDLGIARAPQDNKKGFAVKFFKRLKAIKLANKKDL
jgi:bifunctional UDP-N-acetylglucosamine pyrophosphorylase/glucosamine-1-phosphate N-acetyltransferase